MLTQSPYFPFRSIKKDETMKIARIVGVALASVGIVATSALVSGAAVKPDCQNLMYPLCPRSVASSQVVDNSLPGKTKLAPNSVDRSRLDLSLQADIDAVKDDSVHLDSLDANVRRMLANDANTPDVKGDMQHAGSLPPKVIENLGGKYFGDTTATDDDRYTKIGEVVVPEGSWMVYTSVQFTRTAEGVAGSRPQIGLRIDQDQTKTEAEGKWGVSVGTIGGNDIAPYKGADLFGQTVEPLVTTKNTTVSVYGFGYNDDRSAAGSGQIAAAVKIVLVRA